MKYTKREYSKYVEENTKEMAKLGIKENTAIPFEDWKKFQPAADKAIGIINKELKQSEIIK
jgi:hypothetical protein